MVCVFVRIVHFQVKHFDYLVNESLGHRLTPPWGTCEPLEIVAVFDNALKEWESLFSQLINAVLPVV